MLVYVLSFFVVNLCSSLVISEEVCTSSECVRVSQYILSNMNTTVDPCVDLYQFACGGWIQQNDIPPGKVKWSVFRKMRESISNQLIELLEEDGYVFKGKNSSAVKKAKQFYKSCKNVQAIEEKGFKPLIELIDHQGTWTVTPINKSSEVKEWTLQDAIQNSHKIMGSSFWGMNIYKDIKNESRNMVYFYQDGLTYYNEDYNTTDVIEMFMNEAMTVGQLLGGDNSTVYRKMSEVFNFEMSLSQIFSDAEHLDREETYKIMTLHDFQRLIGNWINMSEYMEAIFGKDVVDYNDPVVTYMPEYFRKLGALVRETDKEVLGNYIMWNLITNSQDHLPKSLSNAGNGPDQRQRECVIEIRVAIPFVVGALYVDRHFSQETAVKVVIAVGEMEREFINILNQTTWLDEETRKNLTEKAEAMATQVGYPDWIMDPSQLDAKHEDLKIEENEYFRNFLRYTEVNKNKEKKKIKERPWKFLWNQLNAQPDHVDAIYEFFENKIVVLAGLLQEPVVSKDYPKSYMYGSLGFILAHEMIHGFDREGRRFDKHGNLFDTWTPHAVMEFEKRAQCFVDQYNMFQVYGHNISGSGTLVENIADHVGLKLAYRAYKSSIGSGEMRLPGVNFTSDQLYFIGMSQFFCGKETMENVILDIPYSNYPTNDFRVIGSVSNSKEFAEAFNCPVNSPMNPERKCEIY